jgi:hypothetical protein
VINDLLSPVGRSKKKFQKIKKEVPENQNRSAMINVFKFRF